MTQATLYLHVPLIHSEQSIVEINNQQLNDILESCCQNNRRSQKELYTRYYGFAMSIVIRYASNYDNSVEMLNDGFLRIFRDLKAFKPAFDNVEGALMAWIKRVMINTCIDHIRKYSKKESMASVDLEQLTMKDTGQTAEQMLQQKEIIQCIQQLPPTYKMVFNLFAMEGYGHEEIGKMLGISEGTSKSNLFKARQQLQELLQKSNALSYE
jgi:RNA polymerase sigma factor (sigma-70 family)